MALQPPPPIAPKEPRLPKKAKGNIGKTVLVITGIVLGLVLFMALAAFVVTRFINKNDADETALDTAIENTEAEASEEEIEMNEVRAPQEPIYGMNGNYYAMGMLSDLPCSFDLNFSPDGQVKGVFWNILYDIKLDVSGFIDNAGNLALDLGSGNTLSRMSLSPCSQGSMDFAGGWGKSNKPVRISMASGHRSVSNSTSGYEMTIKGGGMTTHPRFVNTGDEAYIYFPEQPFENRMPCYISGSEVTIYNPQNDRFLARFYWPGAGETSTLYITNGNEFEISQR